MLCPNCNNQVSSNDNFCSCCGSCLNKQISKKRGVSLCFILIILTITVAYSGYSYLSKVGSTINLDDSNIPEILPKADTCISPYVENEVLSIFKKDDKFFKFIEQKSINSIKLREKETVVTDNKSAKYICSAIVELQSDSKGFRPINYNQSNAFYNKVHIDYDDSIITRYTSYELPIFYTSQFINDRNYVEISEMGAGIFGCKGICAPIHRYVKKIEVPIVEPLPVVLPKEISLNDKKEIETPSKNEKINSEIKKTNTETKKRYFKLFKRNKREKN